MAYFRNNSRQMKEAITLYANVSGMVVKPLSNTLFRTIHHHQFIAKCTEAATVDGGTYTPMRTPTANMSNLHNHSDVKKLVKQMFGSTICEAPVSENFVTQLVCLGIDTAAMGVAILQNTRRTPNALNGNMQVVGIGMYYPFNRLKQLSARADHAGEYDPMNLQPHTRSQFHANIIWNDLNLLECSLVCKRLGAQTGGIGRLVMMYIIWDAYKRVRQGQQRYDGIYLNVAADERPFQKGRSGGRARFLTAVRKNNLYKFYYDLGFREVKVTYQDQPNILYIDNGDEFPHVRMVLLFSQMDPNPITYMKNNLQVNANLQAVCGRNPKCLK